MSEEARMVSISTSCQQLKHKGRSQLGANGANISSPFKMGHANASFDPLSTKKSPQHNSISSLANSCSCPILSCQTVSLFHLFCLKISLVSPAGQHLPSLTTS